MKINNHIWYVRINMNFWLKLWTLYSNVRSQVQDLKYKLYDLTTFNFYHL